MGTAFASITVFYTPVGGIKTSLNTALGTSSAFIETKAMNIGRDDFSYFLDKITSHITGRVDQTKLVLQIFGSDDENGPFDLLDTIDLSLEDPGYSDPPGKRYYKFRYEDTAVRERWQLHGFDVYGEPGGEEW